MPVFSDWVVSSNSRALHLDSSNVMGSAVVGVSARDAVINSILAACQGQLSRTSNDLTLSIV